MLQIARLAPRVLGDSTDLVRAFLRSRLNENGAGMDRVGKADLYYTIFAIAGLQALEGSGAGDLGQPEGWTPTAEYLRTFGEGEGLDFVHLGALARCRAAIGSHEFAAEVLARLEKHRSRDGGYALEQNAERGNAYGCFVALGAYQDLGVPQPEPLRMVQCLKLLETPDGAWGNLRGMKQGTVTATAAAVTMLHQLGMPMNAGVGEWLLAQAHPQGGWVAVPGAPIPDLLSTATALHALACLECPLPEAIRERCLDFIDSLWNASGGFHGHWADDFLDAEYTFYGLLALGHLGLGA